MDYVELLESKNGQIWIKVILDTWLRKFSTMMQVLTSQRQIFTVWVCLFSKVPFWKICQTMVNNGYQSEMKELT